MCDLSPKAECVPAFGSEGKRGPFVGEVENWDEKRLGNSVGGGNSAGFDIVGVTENREMYVYKSMVE